MICPVCKENNLKSTVHTEGIMTTLMIYSSYYDELGRHHHHDDNARSTIGHCSNGHSFSYRYENNCWCGWKGRLEEYKILDDNNK